MSRYKSYQWWMTIKINAYEHEYIKNHNYTHEYAVDLVYDIPKMKLKVFWHWYELTKYQNIIHFNKRVFF